MTQGLGATDPPPAQRTILDLEQMPLAHNYWGKPSYTSPQPI
jgi:hypothetical protein